jgi:hemerythrin
VINDTPWDETLATGDELVDEHHRDLWALFRELAESEQHPESAERVPDVLERLTEYVIVHFAAEEALMEQTGYPPARTVTHIEEHRRLTSRTRELVVEYRAGRLESTLPIVEFLRDWLGDHIEHCDRRLVEHARSA